MTAGNTEAILGDMAKVMISVPEELLGQFDSLAKQEGRTRSGMIQELMAERVARGRRLTGEEIAERLRAIQCNLGGDAVTLVKANRPKP